MELKFSSEDEDFRQEVRERLESRLAGEFSDLRGRGGAGDQGELVEERKAWEREAGIGSVARRCVEEGARVVISDIHEKRLARATESLARPSPGRSPTR